MPVHGPSEWLARALRSLVEQTFDNGEFLAYLDGKKPEAESILKSFGERFSYSIKDGGEGPAVARNTCINKARSKIIAPPDSDDFWEPNHLAASVQALHDNPQLVLVACPFFSLISANLRRFL